MKDFSENINQFPKIATKQEFSPFGEEFSPEMVVNRTKNDENISENSVYISQKSLAALLEENPELSLHAKNSKGEFITINEENVRNILDFSSNSADKINNSTKKNINAEENDDNFLEIKIPGGNEIPQAINLKKSQKETTKSKIPGGENDDFDEEEYGFDSYVDEEKNLKENLSEETKKFEEEYENDEFFGKKKAEFVDYIAAPAIEKIPGGNEQQKYPGSYIPSELVSKSFVKKVEMVDLDAFVGKNIKKTSVLINRNSEGDIESLEVLCKCGEKTLIKFDFSEYEDEENVQDVTGKTLVVVDNLEEKPLEIDDALEQAKTLRRKELQEDKVIEEISGNFIK